MTARIAAGILCVDVLENELCEGFDVWTRRAPQALSLYLPATQADGASDHSSCLPAHQTNVQLEHLIVGITVKVFVRSL